MSIPHFAMNGPEFLLFYAAVAAATLASIGWYLRRCDDSCRDSAIETPQSVDSYEVAYLLDGQVGLARAVTVALLERGHLRLDHKPQATPRSWLRSRVPQITLGDSASATLEPIEATVRGWFEKPRDATTFAGSELSRHVGSDALRYEESLQAQQLLESADLARARQCALFCGGGVLLGLALVRLLQALPQGQPVGFLVLLCGAAMVALWRVCRAQRISLRGAALRSQLRRNSENVALSSGSRLALATALFGAMALVGTELDVLREYLETAPASNSNPSGGSGDGGGDGGGGCGGGCGGCGG